MFSRLTAALSGPSKQDEQDKAMLLEGLNSSVTQFLKAHPSGADIPVARHNEQALEICSALEDILLHGIRPPTTFMADPTQEEGYSIMWEFLANLTHVATMETLEDLPLDSDASKCKAWIRTALNEGLFGAYMEAIMQGDSSSSARTYYQVGAFFRDPNLEKPEIMCAILKSIEGFTFNLSIGGLCAKPGAKPSNDWSDIAAAVVVSDELAVDPTSPVSPTKSKVAAPSSPARPRPKSRHTPKKKTKLRAIGMPVSEGESEPPSPMPAHIGELVLGQPSIPESGRDADTPSISDSVLRAADSHPHKLRTASGVAVSVGPHEADGIAIAVVRPLAPSCQLVLGWDEAIALRDILAQFLGEHAAKPAATATEPAAAAEPPTQPEPTAAPAPQPELVVAPVVDPMAAPAPAPATALPPGIVDPMAAPTLPPGVSDPMAAPPGVMNPMAADTRPRAPTVVEGSMDWMILEAAKRAKAAPAAAPGPGPEPEREPEPAPEPLAELESASPESETAPEPLAELESADPAPELAPEPLAELESADPALAPEPATVAQPEPPSGNADDSDDETF